MQTVRVETPRLRVSRTKLATYLAAGAWLLMIVADALHGDWEAVTRDIAGFGATVGLPAAWTNGWQILVPDKSADPEPKAAP